MLEKLAVVGPFQCNCRLLVCPKTRDAVIVDPGDEVDTILKMIERASAEVGGPLQVRALFHTHGHLDHMTATREVKETLSASSPLLIPDIYLHKGDEQLYQALKMQAGMFGLKAEDPLPIDRFFEDEQTLKIGALQFTILHTPGHSPGSVSLRLHEDSDSGAKEMILSGDTLFQGSVGRTDLWGGDQDQMFKSIRTRLLTLDDDTRVCPGHGPDSKIGIEKREESVFEIINSLELGKSNQ